MKIVATYAKVSINTASDPMTRLLSRVTLLVATTAAPPLGMLLDVVAAAEEVAVALWDVTDRVGVMRRVEFDGDRL